MAGVMLNQVASGHGQVQLRPAIGRKRQDVALELLVPALKLEAVRAGCQDQAVGKRKPAQGVAIDK